MPCHAILIPSFLPAAATIYRSPKRHAAARQRRHQTTPMPAAAAAARRTHGQSSILFMRVSPRGMYLPQKKKKRGHQMTLGDRHSRKDGRNEKIRHVQKGRQAYIQVGQQPSPPSPPHQFPAESELALCVTVLPPSRAHPVPHTHKSAVIRPHPVPLSIIRGRSYLARVPGRVQWGWGGPRGKGSRLPYHSSRKGGLKHAHDAPRGWKFSKAAATAGA